MSAIAHRGPPRCEGTVAIGRNSGQKWRARQDSNLRPRLCRVHGCSHRSRPIQRQCRRPRPRRYLRSRIDATLQCRGVYNEGGFAMGLGRAVVVMFVVVSATASGLGLHDGARGASAVDAHSRNRPRVRGFRRDSHSAADPVRHVRSNARPRDCNDAQYYC
jgi:hypothetical protein